MLVKEFPARKGSILPLCRSTAAVTIRCSGKAIPMVSVKQRITLHVILTGHFREYSLRAWKIGTLWIFGHRQGATFQLAEKFAIALSSVEAGTHHTTGAFLSHLGSPAIIQNTLTGLGLKFQSEWSTLGDGHNLSCNDSREKGECTRHGILPSNL